MSIPLPAPAERFATLTHWLTQAVVAMLGGNRLPQPLVNLIVDRLRGIKQRFAALAAAGLYIPRPRKNPPRRRPGQAPPKNPLPGKPGWLLPLVYDAASFRSQLDCLFRDPEMAALLAAAPVPMARALRPLCPLCRMLGLQPPDILARPLKTSPAPPAERKPKPPRQRQEWPPPDAPAWMKGLRRSIILPKPGRLPKPA